MEVLIESKRADPKSARRVVLGLNLGVGDGVVVPFPADTAEASAMIEMTNLIL